MSAKQQRSEREKSAKRVDREQAIKDLDVSVKAGDVKGGQKVREAVTLERSGPG